MRLDHLLSMENVVETERYFTVFDERDSERDCCSIFRDRYEKAAHTVGLTNGEGPPVPIPNTEVKLTSVDNTLRATVREDRSMPTRELLERAVLDPYGGVAQLGEHLPCKQGVMGSNPIISTSRKLRHPRKGSRPTDHLQKVDNERTQRYRLIAQQVRARA